MLESHPIPACQTLSPDVIHPNQAHHNGLVVQSSCVRSNISVMSVFGHSAQYLLPRVIGVIFSVGGVTPPNTLT